MTITKTCAECGEPFETIPSKDGKYCSQECYYNDRWGKDRPPKFETVECEVCGEEFETKPAFERKYCSKECQHKSMRGEFRGERYDTPEGKEHPRWVDRETRECPVCGDEYTVRKTSEQKTCSDECGSILQSWKVHGEKTRMVERNCVNNDCEKSFMIKSHKDKKYCCYECAMDDLAGQIEEDKWTVYECKYCGDEFRGYKNYDRKYCSRSCRGKDTMNGSDNPNFGKDPVKTKWVDVEQTGHKVRSTWEAKVDIIFNEINIEYEYEPVRFDLGNMTYRPDFIINNKIVVEVKGYPDPKSAIKAKKFMSNTDYIYVVIGGRLPSDIHIEWGDFDKLKEVVQ